MFDKIVQSLFYAALAAIVIIGVVGVVIRRINSERLPAFYNYVGGIIIGFSLVTSTVFLTLSIEENKVEGAFNPALFYPILSLLLLTLVLAVGLFFVAHFKKDKLQIYTMGSFILTTIYILFMVFLDPLKQYIYASFSGGVLAGLIVSVVILLAILIALPLVFGKKRLGRETQALVYAAVSIALSFALSYFRLFKLPQGGSVTFASLLPLIVFSYKFGIRKGVVAGFIYGILQAIQDPWIVHPLQFLLDYPLAFAGIGLAGIFREVQLFKRSPLLNFIAGGILASIFRYAAHAISGILVFGSYAPDAFSPVAWGLLYNTFVFADIAITLVAGGFLFASKSGRRLISK
ncbi:MAG: energy-coupled thiamine transporter ThiT [Clostridia bacterium]